MNLCFSCEKPTQEDQALRGKHICVNQRCVRVGLLSVFVLVPEKKEEKPKEKKENKDDKNISESGGK